jgi:eukaryotic-like serine/threonine-protein kinase
VTQLPPAIGRYQVQALLGRGAMGAVYKAYDPDIDRPVAIKLVHTALLEGADRADYIRRFRQEAQAVGRCSHPNIVALYDIAVHEGDPYLVMEFVDGVALDQHLVHQPRLPEPQAIAIAAQVLDALACAHAAGIVHRDIKPGNILLRPDGQAKVTDFGISRISSSELTQVGMMIGTPSYMSPEQMRGEPCGPASDQFSLASVLYLMLCGRRPFPGDSVGAIAAQMLRGPPDPIEGLAPALAAVLARAHASHPEDRFASAAAMAVALRAAQQGAQQDGRPATEERTIVLNLAPALPHAQDHGSVHGRSDPTVPRTLTAVEIETVARDLARYLGPIARIMTNRAAAGGATTMTALREHLAPEIKDPKARQAFLGH